MIPSNGVASVLVATIVATICGAVLATTGQTAAQEAAVLSAIDEAGMRTIIVYEGSGGSGFDPAALERILALGDTESAIGLGPGFDVRNSLLLGGGEPVPARVVFGGQNESLFVDQGRWPQSGEAIVGSGALDLLRLEVPSGAITKPDAAATPIVGSFVGSGPFASLEEGVLVAANPADTTMRSILIVAVSPDVVEPLAAAVVEVLSPTDLSSLLIETSASLADVRQAVKGELGRFSRSLILFALLGGLVLTAVTVLGTVSMRRRDFGRRRVLGASRSAIVVIVLVQTGGAALIGSIVGSAVGVVVAEAVGGAAPPGTFVVGVGVLAVLAVLAAATVPALVAALRDPVRVLRVP